MPANIPVFWRHAATVLTGTVAAQALPLLAAPLITRLCTPGEMGAFSLWMGIVAIAATVATLRLEAAMILDHGTGDQQTCFSVVAYSSTVLAIAMTLAAVSARAWNIPQAQHMTWLGLTTLGVATWLTAYNQTVLAYATSNHAFGKAALAKVCGAGTVALGQVVLLQAGIGGNALVAGQVIGLASGLIAAVYLLSPPHGRIALMPTVLQRNYLVKHASFWRFSLPSGLLNTVAGKIPLFLIGMKYGLPAAGLFALTERMLTAPLSLLASSVLEVFKRQSVHEYQTLGNCEQAFRSTFKALVLLGCAPALLILAFAPSLCAWIFGEPWREAGEFARILAPLYFVSFVVSPLSYVFFVAGKQKVELVWQIALFITTLTVFLAPVTLTEVLLNYAISYSALYVVYFFLAFKFARNAPVPT